MKIISIICLIILSCGRGDRKVDEAKNKPILVTVDSCEYVMVMVGWYDGIAITHHGNCHNPKHLITK